MVSKRKFKLPYHEGLVDIYLDDKKVYDAHNGTREHIYFHLNVDVNPEVSIAEHDKRIGIEVEIKDGQIVPLVIERKIITAGVDVLEAETTVEFSHRADVEVVKRGDVPNSFKKSEAVTPKSIEEYASPK